MMIKRLLQMFLLVLWRGVVRGARATLSVEADPDRRAVRPGVGDRHHRAHARRKGGEDSRHHVRRRQPAGRQRPHRRPRSGQRAQGRVHDHGVVQFGARGEPVPVQGTGLRPGQGLRAHHGPDHESACPGRAVEPPGAEHEGVHPVRQRTIRASSTSARATRARSPMRRW